MTFGLSERFVSCKLYYEHMLRHHTFCFRILKELKINLMTSFVNRAPGFLGQNKDQ